MTIQVLHDGWLIWDGVVGVVRTGEVTTTSLACHATDPWEGAADAEVGLEQVGPARYRAVARLLALRADCLVLDLGEVSAVTWVRPGENAPVPPGSREGDLLAGEIVLSIDAWQEAAWSRWAARHHGTDHELLVRRIVRVADRDGSQEELDEASVDTVASAGEHCLLTCEVRRPEPHAS